jgi:hypothetical protein
MDEDPCRRFFAQPACPAQRQYEALRAVFLEGLSQKEAASRLGYSYDALRQLVHDFRQGCLLGTPPPFSPQGRAAGPAPPWHRQRRRCRSSPPSPTPGS